ncbi:hypothetical protein [Flavobacterium sp.]|uniref:hypothetical protein n=1 Tax=Flavobacterium sp. TaxID=239 RepID=UPI00261F009B|nr:hypothetical protein [Flavobacterium sp.]
MNKTIYLCFSLFLLFANCQEIKAQIVKEYKIEVFYKYGVDTITIENYRKLPNIPEPKVSQESVFYDGEYLLEGVKKIKILNKVFLKESKKTNKIVNVVNYKIPNSDKYFQVIYYPSWQDTKGSGRGLFNDKAENDTLQKKKIEEKQPQNEIISNKDTIVYSSKQFVYEYDENRNLKRIENSGLKLVGDAIENESDEELFIRKDIDKNSQEYLELSQLNLKKGIYILEKNLNKENELVYFRIVAIKSISREE